MAAACAHCWPVHDVGLCAGSACLQCRPVRGVGRCVWCRPVHGRLGEQRAPVCIPMGTAGPGLKPPPACVTFTVGVGAEPPRSGRLVAALSFLEPVSKGCFSRERPTEMEAGSVLADVSPTCFYRFMLKLAVPFVNPVFSHGHRESVSAPVNLSLVPLMLRE